MIVAISSLSLLWHQERAGNERVKSTPTAVRMPFMYHSTTSTAQQVSQAPDTGSAPTTMRSTTTTTQAPRMAEVAGSVGTSTSTSTTSVFTVKDLSPFWSCIAFRESTWRNVVNSHGDEGYFQIDPATWRGVGLTGSPITHTLKEQLAGARLIARKIGLRQWETYPLCAGLGGAL